MILKRIFLSFMVMCWFTVHAQEIFIELHFVDAVEKAESENKHIYVFGTTSWCNACKQMANETFADSSVVQALHDNFVSINVDLESEPGIDLAVKYRASPAPQHLIFDSNGYLVRRGQGYYDSKPFLEMINAAVDSLPQLAALPHPLNFELDYPDWYRDFRKPPAQRTFPDARKVDEFLDSRDSITDEVTWAVLYSLPTSEKYAPEIAANKDILAARYGKNEVLEKLSAYVYADVKQAIKDRSESALYAAMRKADRLLGTDADLYKFRYLLYYYQYNNNWSAYADIGAELAQNRALKKDDWLNEIATNIYSNTKEYAAITHALSWMYPLTQDHENYHYFLTTARLEYTLGNTDKTRSLVKKALASADNETDTREAEKLMQILKSD